MSEKRYQKFVSENADTAEQGKPEHSVARRFLREAWEISLATGIAQRFLFSFACGASLAILALILGEWRGALAFLVFVTGGLFVALLSDLITRRFRLLRFLGFFR